MKKAIVTVVSLAVVLCAVLIYRAETVFQDWQVEPAPGLTEVGFDNEAAVQRFTRQLTAALNEQRSSIAEEGPPSYQPLRTVPAELRERLLQRI